MDHGQNINVSASHPSMFVAWWNSKINPVISDKPYRVHACITRLKLTHSNKFRELVFKLLGDKFEMVASDVDYTKATNHKVRRAFHNIIAINHDDNIVVSLAVDDEDLDVRVYSHEAGVGEPIIDKLDQSLPKVPQKSERDDTVYFKFWYLSSDGPMSHIREIVCPSVLEIKDNYTDEINNAIGKIVNLKEPDKKGKIILWQGEPGTGKTFAVRALARAWANNINASIEIVLDPEVMLANSDYMYSLLLDQAPSVINVSRKRSNKSKTDLFESHQFDDFDEEDYEEENTQPVRLIIIEDHAELFADRCRQTAGFSRFLNLTDGIVGQGVRAVFLLTANEEIEDIDGAVQRPGRCIAINKFNQFNREEALKWLEVKGYDLELPEKDQYSLAFLYELINKNAININVDDLSNFEETPEVFGF